MIEKKKTIVGANTKNPPTSHRPGHGGSKYHGEKPKDFKKTWSKLIKYAKKQVPFVIIAIISLIAAVISAIIWGINRKK